MNFGQLQDRVETYVLDLPTATLAEIPGWINSAMRAAQDRHNFRFMEASTQFTTTAATRKLADLPATWKEHRALPYLTADDGATREIHWAASSSEMVRLFGVSTTLDIGDPEFVHENGDQLDVWPFPDGLSDYAGGEYRVTVPYWSRFADMSLDADTNWLTQNAADYLTFYATAEAMTFNREEERAAVYVSKAERDFTRLVRRDKRSRLDNRFTMGFHRDVHATRFQRRRAG